MKLLKSPMFLIAATLAAGALSASPALACDDEGCGGAYQRVLVRPARTYVHVVPAQYGSVTETYVQEPAHRVAHVVPPIYRTVSEPVMVQPAHAVAETVPPVYETVTEQVPVRVSSGCGCEHTVYQAYRHVVQVRPASVVYHHVPAVYASRARTVEVRPAQTVYETIPAVYGTQTRTVEVAPARAEYETAPAEYGTVYRAYARPRPVDTGCGCQSDE